MSLLQQSFYRRYGLWIIAISFLALPVWVYGLIEANKKANNNVRQWLPQQMDATVTYDRFREHFGSDEFAVVTWKGMRLGDPQARQLAEILVPADEQDREPYFARVITPEQLLAQLTGGPFNLSEAAARQRLQGIVLGDPSSDAAQANGDAAPYTLMLVILTPEGDANRLAAVRRLREIVIDDVGIPPEELHMAGDPVTNAAIDVESERAIGALLAWSMIVAFLVAWWSVRSFRLIVAVFLVAGYSFILSQGLVYFLGGQMNLVLVVMPVLVFVLTLSAGIHVTNYYRDAAEEVGRAAAPAVAIAHGWIPCLLAATTTAVGVGSLYVSRIIPVKEFGYYSAVGIMASLALIFLLLPSLLTCLDRWTRRGQDLDAPVPKPDHMKFFARQLSRFGDFTIRHANVMAIVCLLVLIGFSCGVPYIKTSVKPRRFFPPNHQLVQDFDWLAERFGPQIPVEVVVGFDRSQADEQQDGGVFQDTLKRMQLVRAIELRIRQHPEIGGTMSAATFTPSLRDPTGFQAAARRYAFNERLSSPEARQLLKDAHYLSETEDQELWRITARVRGFDDEEQDYAEFLADLEQDVKQYLAQVAAEEPRLIEGIRIEYTGMVPLFFAAQNELLNSLNTSFMAAFGIIAVLVIILLRSFAAGLLSMLPNVFPAAVIFGGMGWTGTIVDIGSMMTASVAMGIAVDDTLHFLTWFRRGVTLGLSRNEAIQFAYDRCGIAMMQTTAIAGLGLAVYALSSFQPVSQFGLLMFILLIGALIGDLVFLPALLATRLGKVFASKTAHIPAGLQEQVAAATAATEPK